MDKIEKVNYPQWQLAPPNPNVSPLIRFGRWSFLILGISYGFLRHRYLQRRADKNKELRDSRLALRAIAKAEEKERLNIESLRELEKSVGVKLI